MSRTVSSEHYHLRHLIAKCRIELAFLNDDCELLHGDISMGNIIIVRFLPKIISAACELDLATVNTDEGAGSLPIILATTNAASLTSLDDPPEEPILDVELLRNLGSGGSVIDFDYSRSLSGNGSLKASVSLGHLLVCQILIML